MPDVGPICQFCFTKMEVVYRPSNQKEMNSFIKEDNKQTNRDNIDQMMENIYEPTGEN